jgi:acyl-CoA thioester hydrolase
MKFQDYRHHIPIQIRFSDIDRLQHVNNACYHNYVELGRVRYFNKVLNGAINWDLQGFVLARTEIDHIESLFLDDEAHCFTRVYELGNKSLKMHTSIVALRDGELRQAAKINGILVAMDYTQNKSVAIPDEWRKMIGEFEGI